MPRGRTACCRLVRCRTPSLYLLVDVDKTLAGMITSGPACHDRAETSLRPDIGMVAGMRQPPVQPGDPVTADDVDHAVTLAMATMSKGAAPDWHAAAAALEWDCWETVEHMSDDLFSYAAQLGPKRPPLTAPVPFRCYARRSGGPVGAIFADPDAGPHGLLQVFEASGALLSTMVAASKPDPGEPRPFGVADPACFAAAMGVVEVLVHTHDVAQGLGLAWTPPGELGRRALSRLSPMRPRTQRRGRPCCGRPGEASLRVGRRSPRGAGTPGRRPT